MAATNIAASAMPPPTSRQAHAKRSSRPSCRTARAAARTAAGTEQQHDGQSGRLVPQRLGHPPADTRDEPDEERQVRPGEVAVEQRARCPEADQARLVGRHLERLGRLEDQGPEGQGRHQPDGTDDRRRHRPAREVLAAHEEAEPQDGDGEEPGHRGQLVEVGGDQPDQADADEAGTEGEQDPADGEPGPGPGPFVVAARDLGGLGVGDDTGGGPVGELGAQPGQVLAGTRRGWRRSGERSWAQRGPGEAVCPE